MSDSSPTPEKKPKGVSAYLKYSGLAFQMAGIIFLSILIGQQLDSYWGLQKPYATVVISLIGLTGFMYKLYIDLMKDKE